VRPRMAEVGPWVVHLLRPRMIDSLGGTLAGTLGETQEDSVPGWYPGGDTFAET
jgi:hypothetical protein